eukprot:1043889-Prorocentrum_minimum.AAC.2
MSFARVETHQGHQTVTKSEGPRRGKFERSRKVPTQQYEYEDLFSCATDFTCDFALPPRPLQNIAAHSVQSAVLNRDSSSMAREKKRTFLDDDDEPADDIVVSERFSVNKEYAKRFQHNKERDELQRLQSKFGGDEDQDSER